MRTIRIVIAAGLLTILSSHQAAIAAIAGLERVASSVSAPMFVTHAPGDRDRLFIAQRSGDIRILDLSTGSLLATPFLSMPGIDPSGEGGFLGLAFHPDYFNEGTAGFGKFYVNVTTGSPFTSRIREFQVSTTNPNVAELGSLREVLSFTQPQQNHNGGWIGFSPTDGYLYIATGDGGGGNDDDAGHTPGIGNAQDITDNLLGKMLRIDVAGDDFPADATRNYAIPATNPFVAETGDDEIWSYGLRNPFRASFDRLTADLWIGDVGQGAREEIDFQPDGRGGDNYGWRLREGSIQTPTSGIGGPKPPGNVDPVYDYPRPISNPQLDPEITEMNQYRGTTVIGGYIYRGPDPSLQGQYFFLDRNGGTAGINYWIFDPADPYGSVQNIDSLLTPNTGRATGPVSMGEDAVGNLYVTYFSGEVFRIVTSELLTGDFYADGDVDADDYDEWRSSFGSQLTHPAAGATGNAIADAADYVAWRKNLGASVHDALGAGHTAPEPAAAAYFTAALAILYLAPRRPIRRRQ